MTTLVELGEFALIERITRHFPPLGGGDVGPGDDAATLTVPAGQQLVISTDSLVEGVHFRLDWTAASDLAHKSLHVAISDIVAMGVRPSHFMLSLSLPAAVALPWLDEFAEELARSARDARVGLCGGNITRGDAVSITITAWGFTPTNRVWRRSGAVPGHAVGVIGTLGGAAAGLDLLQRNSLLAVGFPALLSAQHRPTAQLQAQPFLAEVPSPGACIDVSDGFAQDLSHILKSSGVGARLEIAAFPLSPGLSDYARETGTEAWRWAAGGGGDYALIVCTSREFKCPGLTWVGDVVATPGVHLSSSGEALELDENLSGFRHF